MTAEIRDLLKPTFLIRVMAVTFIISTHQTAPPIPKQCWFPLAEKGSKLLLIDSQRENLLLRLHAAQFMHAERFERVGNTAGEC